MIQEILTYAAVAWAFWQVVIFFWRIFHPKKQTASCGGGCGGSCSAKTDLLKHIEKGKFPTLVRNDHS